MKLLKIISYPSQNQYNTKELYYADGVITTWKNNLGKATYSLDLNRMLISGVKYANYAYFDTLKEAKYFLINKKGTVSTKFGEMKFN